MVDVVKSSAYPAGLLGMQDMVQHNFVFSRSTRRSFIKVICLVKDRKPP